jgi:hypothetical protein
VLLAIASEVDELTAGDLDEVADTSGGDGLFQELRVEDLAALANDVFQ